VAVRQDVAVRLAAGSVTFADIPLQALRRLAVSLTRRATLTDEFALGR
jgi:hypothetical protein